MVERHYDEDVLVTMLDARIIESDPHLAVCGECSERLEDFRMVTEALRDTATWDLREDPAPNPNPNTIATLRAFADTMAAEDAAAATYLTELLAGPRETWIGNLHAHPEWRTAGVVRALVAATDRALDTMPADAVEITALAVEIADHLGADGTDRLMRLRGTAWRARAYALYYTGAFAAAAAAVQHSADHYRQCTSVEYEVARLNIVRSLVDGALELSSSAAFFAKQSADAFRAFGDVRRTASAGLAHVHLLFTRADFHEAMKVLRSMEVRVHAAGDAVTHAQILGNLGFCAWKLGNLEDALTYHEAAAALLTELGNTTEAVRERWNVASVLATAGNLDEAFKRLERVRSDFENLGVVNGVAQVSLEMAELLLTRRDFARVEELCHSVMSAFKAAGMAHTTLAMTALAYMGEAVRNRKATPALARHVREYIRQLPQSGQQLFVPPPS